MWGFADYYGVSGTIWGFPGAIFEAIGAIWGVSVAKMGSSGTTKGISWEIWGGYDTIWRASGVIFGAFDTIWGVIRGFSELYLGLMVPYAQNIAPRTLL